jgi:hypothetical protein
MQENENMELEICQSRFGKKMTKIGVIFSNLAAFILDTNFALSIRSN